MNSPSISTRLSGQRSFKKPRAVLVAAVAVLHIAGTGLRAATLADWKFDAANPTADSSGNGNTLALNGNITFTSDVATNDPGATNSAIFDGASYAQTVATLNLAPYNQLTIECFAKYTPDNGLQMFYSQDNPNNVYGAFYFDMNEAAGQVKVSQRTATGAFETDQAPEPTDGAWHHYALTMDESGASPIFKIYVDGYEVDTGGAAGGLGPFINDYFTIGAYPPTYDFNYAGEMGELRVSSGILTPAQFLIGAQAPVIVISQQPQSEFAVTNSQATFNVVATVQGGNPTPSLQYQWQSNGVNIASATNSSYTLAASLNDNSVQFDVVLSAPPATTVTSSNATLTVVTNATVADWKFDAANPTADSSGNGNTLALNGNITFTNDVATNEAGSTNSAVFDGASYAQTVATLNLALYNQLTIEFFVKYVPDNGLQMFYAVNNVNNVEGAFYFDMGEAGPTELKVSQRTASSFKIDQAPEPTDGAWHHYALTMDESAASPVFKIYVDGYQVDTAGTGGAIQPFINDYFTIGGFPPTYVYNYAGEMGEMRVSSGILTPAQFLIGAALPKIFITQQPQNTGVVTNNPATFQVFATVQNGNPSPQLQYQWQSNGVNIAGATNSSYTLPAASLNDNSVQFGVVLSAPPAAPVISSNATLTVLTNAALAYWEFNSANPTADSSGNGNTLALNGNITFTNDVPTSAPGSTNSAVFDGASYAQTMATLDLTPYDQLTIEFFAKFSSGSPLQMFYAVNNVNNVEGAFYFDTGEAGPTELKVSQRTTGANFETDQAPEPTDGAWHHYALTMDESGATPVFKIYVDGNEVDTGGGAGGIQPFINDYFTIGAFPPSYNFGYQGLMDELRVSTGILTPEQFLTGPAIVQISPANGNMVISWPQNAANYTLQQTDNLLGPWTIVTNTPASSGLTWQVTLPTAHTAMFYRLIR